MREELVEAGLSLESLHELAIDNLQKLTLPELCLGKTPGGPEAWLRQADDNFNAARVLLPNVQESLATQLGEPFCVALPCRDWLVCWSEKQATDWQAKNRAEALRIFREDSHNLTPDILEFRQGMFTVSTMQSPNSLGTLELQGEA